MKIVKMSAFHIKDIVRMGKQNWSYAWISPHFFKITMKKPGYHFTAMEKGKPVGCVMIVEEDYPKYWLDFLVVDKDHQRKGIGTALMREIESGMKENAIIFLDTEKKDRSAIRFYRKNKFKTAAKIKDWFENGTEGIIMVKKVGA